jgi:rhamnogalacturonyl hydrolase YesR
MNPLKFLLLVALLIASPIARAAEPLPPLATRELAERVLAKGLAEIDLGLYPGTLLMQAMSELALIDSNSPLRGQAVELFKKFVAKEIKGRGSFISYQVGGSGAALLRWRGVAPELDRAVADAAKRMMDTQKRSSESLLVPPWVVAEKDQVFIDVAFAVTPFILYAGLAEKNERYIDLAIFETIELVRILRDTQTGLLHQGRGFQGLGVVSQDNWSRGNGWGAMGLAALVRDLPADHPMRKNVEVVAKEFFSAVLRYQNKAGLWHQEMTDPSSYTETSGSGLLLYGLGVMLERGLVDRKHEADFTRGLAALPAYIAADGSVGHTCIGCLCPGDGTKEDYKNRVWAHNDSHAFGAVVLAYAQALKLGVTSITPTVKPGVFAAAEDTPGKPRTYVLRNPTGAQNINWENDRIAFRVYGPTVRHRVGSGIDIWPKSVDYPVIDKWYRLSAAGFDYHTERGEGVDFYHVGRERGCGGSAIWRNGRPFPSETYSTYRIVANESDHVEFTLEFEPWDADGLRVSETKTIRLVPGTNFFQVTHTVHTAGTANLTVGLALTTFGQSVPQQSQVQGTMSLWEKADPAQPMLGTAIIADPRHVTGFGEAGKDRYMLLSVKPNEPFTYFVGAAWAGNSRFKAPGSWDALLRQEADWTKLNALFARLPAKP